jgi:FkbM family methyltransferase
MSQIGQDFWVAGEVFNGMRGGYFLDIGAADGYDISNSFLLETRYGWSGLCVEANPETFQTLRACRRVQCVNACIDADVGSAEFRKDGLFGGIVATGTDASARTTGDVVSMPTTTLGRLLDEYRAPKRIDYMSIDVEGAEDRILGGFDFDRYSFNAITIERPSAMLRALLADHRYRMVKEVPGLDAFFIHEDFLETYVANAISFWTKTV